MTKGTHLLRSALLALLALAVISGGSLAAGDLFDDDYKDCPYQTRLRDGQIADLTVARDSDDADHVNVSWSATDASVWGLGSNAYNTSLVVILDDGDLNTKTLALGSRKATFEGIETGKSVKVQLAIVVDHADGDYLISDILEQSINQSLSKPAFMADVMQVTRAAVAAAGGNAAVPEVARKTKGTMYYVGYNENFGNYKADALNTMPSTARLRIGLAHSPDETDGERDDVDFDAYIIRITDEDGDVVSEGDDVATMKSSYAMGRNRLVFGTVGDTGFLTGLASRNMFSNVRINDGGTIRASVQDKDSSGPQPDVYNSEASDATAVENGFTAATVAPSTIGLSYVRPATGTTRGTVYAELPNEHRDFPVDVLSSDETYTFKAWAIDEDRVVISPVASLKVRPIDETVTLGESEDLRDYVGTTDATSLTDVLPNTGLRVVDITEFTVLK